MYALEYVHTHVKQMMCCGTYLVQVNVDSYMSQTVKQNFKDIWILTNAMIKEDHICCSIWSML